MAAVSQTGRIINDPVNNPFSASQDTQEQHNHEYQSTDQLQSPRDEGEDVAHSSWSQEHSRQQQEINRKSDDNNNNSNHQGTGNAANTNINNERNQQNDDQNGAAQRSWYKRVVDNYGSLELDNKGSVARDHLALERTFLAWLRTSLAFASIGIAVTQLFRLNSSITCGGKPSTFSDTSSSSNPLLPESPSPSPLSSSLLEILLAPPSSSLSSTDANSNNSNAAARFRKIGKPLGATFIGIAVLILVIGFHRYFESQYWIVRGKFPASRGSVALVSFVAGGLVVASFVVILAAAPSAMEL